MNCAFMSALLKFLKLPFDEGRLLPSYRNLTLPQLSSRHARTLFIVVLIREYYSQQKVSSKQTFKDGLLNLSAARGMPF